MQISGTSVLLSGATGGIGNAVASALADRAANLIVTGRRGDKLGAPMMLTKQLVPAMVANGRQRDKR